MYIKYLFLSLTLLLFLPQNIAADSADSLIQKAEKVLPPPCLFYFKMFLNAQDPKAFAYTIDAPGKFACRFSQNSDNQKKANEVALHSCEKTRKKRGIQTPCKLYKISPTLLKTKKKRHFEKKYLLNLKSLQAKRKTKALPKKEKNKPSYHDRLPKPCHMFYALYEDAADFKAFAIAIDDNTHYVCKFSAAASSAAKAKEVALQSCQKSKKERAVQAPCRLFTPVQTHKSTQKNAPYHKQTPLTIALQKAISKADLKTIKILIKKGADINTPAADQSRALFVAVAKGDIAFTKKLLKKGAYPYFRTASGNNLLVAAIMSGSNQMLTLLLKHKISPNRRCEEGNTPLHFALMMFDDKMMRSLYRYKARDNIKNNKGETVKDLAKKYHVDLKRIKRSSH